jgi:hypothetical protein
MHVCVGMQNSGVGAIVELLRPLPFKQISLSKQREGRFIKKMSGACRPVSAAFTKVLLSVPVLQLL